MQLAADTGALDVRGTDARNGQQIRPEDRPSVVSLLNRDRRQHHLEVVGVRSKPYKLAGRVVEHLDCDELRVMLADQLRVASSLKLGAGESVVVAIPRIFDNEPGADTETTVIVALTPRILDTLGSAAVIESNH